MTLAPQRQLYRLTHDEYLTIERASPERHEYLDGVMYAMDGGERVQAMTGASENHGMISIVYERVAFPARGTTP